MHELALADAIVQASCRHAGGRDVAKVELKVGRLRQVVPDALVFAFELVAHGTPLEGAELELEEVPVRVACHTCGAETEVERFPLACGGCGNLDVVLVAGEEFHIEALEIEAVPA
jgi:hydrogenase nickel incorporation protein HypA/HybF